MKRRRRSRSKRMRVLRLWQRSELAKAIPYLRSVTGSLREHYLELLRLRRKDERDRDAHAPRDREQLIAAEKRSDELERAQAKFDDALEELNGLDVYLLNPVQGLALVPFRKEDDLAWFIFDHFAKPGIVGWRYHVDPIDERRPLSQLPASLDDDDVRATRTS